MCSAYFKMLWLKSFMLRLLQNLMTALSCAIDLLNKLTVTKHDYLLLILIHLTEVLFLLEVFYPKV